MVNNQLIGLFGGAFDPIHNAHLSIAKNCIDKLGLDKIIIIPTGKSVIKKNLASHYHRLEMTKLVFNTKYFEVSDFEIREYINKKKVSFTIDTLKHFAKNNSNTYFFILGSDSLSSVESWKKWKDLTKYVHLIIIERQIKNLMKKGINSSVNTFINDNLTENINDLKKHRNGLIYRLPMPLLHNSSSDIQNKVKNNINTSKLLPKKIQDYIIKNKLYS